MYASNASYLVIAFRKAQQFNWTENVSPFKKSGRSYLPTEVWISIYVGAEATSWRCRIPTSLRSNLFWICVICLRQRSVFLWLCLSLWGQLLLFRISNRMLKNHWWIRIDKRSNLVASYRTYCPGSKSIDNIEIFCQFAMNYYFNRFVEF
jgi:hypothetical protein